MLVFEKFAEPVGRLFSVLRINLVEAYQKPLDELRLVSSTTKLNKLLCCLVYNFLSSSDSILKTLSFPFVHKSRRAHSPADLVAPKQPARDW